MLSPFSVAFVFLSTKSGHFLTFVFRRRSFNRVLKFRATLTGGAHRLAAVLSCEADFTRYLAGEEPLYDWSVSPYSESKPPGWLREVPATLHFYGGVDAFLKISVAIGHAQNNLSAGSAPTTYYDKIFYIRGMRYGLSPKLLLDTVPLPCYFGRCGAFVVRVFSGSQCSRVTPQRECTVVFC